MSEHMGFGLAQTKVEGATFCMSCDSEIERGLDECPHCGADFRPPRGWALIQCRIERLRYRLYRAWDILKYG